MSDLIKRLQEAESGSRELDVAVMRESGLSMSMMARDCPSYTTSLDSIVALIGEKLPGQFWAVSEHPDGFVATIGGPFVSETRAVTFGTAPLALGIALLTALQSQEPTP